MYTLIVMKRWARVSTDEAYSYVVDSGEYIAREHALQYCIDNDELSDYYDQDALDNAIEEAKTEWKREVLEARSAGSA